MSGGSASQHLKVGELAKATGLTVRTLHHYDEIGLLKPSGRSESGYRLYSPADVARLHGIQAMRQMGLALADIAALYEGRGAAPATVVEQQMRALDHEIARATELRAQLALIRDKLAEGERPEVASWLQVLQQMATYGKYFSASELKSIFDGFEPLKEDWTQLIAEIQQAMDRGLPIDSAEVQSLARRWMSLMLGWMNGDFEMMQRWGEMYQREHLPVRGKDTPPQPMIEFMRAAADLRMEAIRRHFTPEELTRFRHVPEREWQRLDADIRRAAARRPKPDEVERQALVQRWSALMDRLLDGDRALRDKLLAVGRKEPLFGLSSPISPAARAFLQGSA